MNIALLHSLFWLLTAFYGVGLCLPMVSRLLSGRWRVASVHFSLLAALLGSGVAVIGALLALRDPDAWRAQVVLLGGASGVAYLPRVALELRIDRLSGFFILLIAGFAIVVAIYSFGALRAPHFQAQRPRIAAAFNAFIWSTLLVVMVNDLFSLFVALELMTMAFAFLALYKHNYYLEPRADWYHAPDTAAIKDARLAPQIYLIISHTSTAFLLLASLLLAKGATGLDFDALRLQASRHSPFLATVVFLLALAGLGIRAGLTPAHFWVSLVHPASPTSTHAFSLGIAIKVAIYLMCRFFFQFLTPQSWWGYLLLTIAVVTALVNVWFAIASHDLKKALAYHSIENIGIIVAGIAVALIYATRSDPAGRWIASLALIAALYHLLNHAVFKGLLYLCTGAIDDRTGQVMDIEHLGGLIRLWPWTAGTFLVGALAISGFPPLNGFISEWLTLQALLGGLADSPSATTPLLGAVVLTLGLALLVASFGLTAFCFLKISGLALLGAHRASTETVSAWQKHNPKDVGWPMRAMMVAMAALCFVLGILPGLALPVLAEVSGTVLGRTVAVSPVSITALTLSPPVISPSLGLSLLRLIDNTAIASTQLSLLSVVVVALVLSGGVLYFTTRRKRASLRPENPWNCGTSYIPAQMQTTSAALSFLIRDLFGAGLQLTNPKYPPDYLPAKLEMSEGAQRADPRGRQVIIEVFRIGYNQVIDWLLRGSATFALWGQNGDLGRYLLYILFANLAALLLFLVLKG